MMNTQTENNTPYDDLERRRRHRAALRRRKQQVRRNRRIALCILILLLAAVTFLVRFVLKSRSDSEQVNTTAAVTGEAGAEEAGASSGSAGAPSGSSADIPSGSETSSSERAGAAEGNEIRVDSLPVQKDPEVAGFFEGYSPRRTGNTRTIANTEKMQSNWAILINADTGEVTAELGGSDRIIPASMTKILTVLTAVEELQKGTAAGMSEEARQSGNFLDDTFTVTIDITAYSYRNGGSAVGFGVDETVTVRDLLYGTILPSGADAALSLALYTAGSHEAFVELMNRKVAELGLSGTSHFTNCVGLYDDDLYTTPSDMAMILKAAVENDLCREVLSAHTYTTSSTAQHPEGITISNWFLRRIEDKDTHGTVRCAKTGYVKESWNCAASYQISNDGGHYICVTAHAHSAWRAIYDHVEIYDLYTE